MLRPVLAAMALALAVFIVTPTMADVGEAIESLDIRRDLPVQFWKADLHQSGDLGASNCNWRHLPLDSEVTQWPPRIQKDEPFTLGGVVLSPFEGDAGVGDVEVDLYLNETKTEPGVYLGTTHTDGVGAFTLTTTIPFTLEAKRYHLIAHAHDKQEGCIQYLHHWSDPELDVVSSSRLWLQVPDVIVVGHETVVEGRLLDSVGMPLAGREVVLDLGGDVATVETDSEGRFAHVWMPPTSDKTLIVARFHGDAYHEEARITRDLHVVSEHVSLGPLDDHARVAMQRGRDIVVDGQVLLSPGRDAGELAFVFNGFEAATCADCPPVGSLVVTPDATGRFELVLHVPSDQPVGTHGVVVRGASLEGEHAFPAHLMASTRLTLDANGAGWFGRELESDAVLVDDAGDPVAGTISFMLPTGESMNVDADASGVARLSSASPCGVHRVDAVYEGSDVQAPATTTAEATVCPFSFALLGVPLWAWVAALFVPALGVYVLRGAARSRADVLVDGPPLALHVATPDDEAAGVIGCGEAVDVVLRLRSPLPEGHSLRVGTHLGMETVIPDAQGMGRSTFVPPRVGGFALRGEIVDRRGRVVTRRTARLRAVDYAQEIEARYLDMQPSRAEDGAASLSPREFESWLRARDNRLEPDVIRRLVHLFEEADYGPRMATRRDLLAFLRAQQAVRVDA